MEQYKTTKQKRWKKEVLKTQQAQPVLVFSVAYIVLATLQPIKTNQTSDEALANQLKHRPFWLRLVVHQFDVAWLAWCAQSPSRRPQLRLQIENWK